MSHSLVFIKVPIVTLSTNKFVGIPVILKYEDTPMLEIINEQGIGFTTQIPIFHSDGTYLAKVRGNRVFLTPEGKKANIVLEQPMGKTVCKLDNRILFELTHGVGDEFKADAELHTPDGYFLKCDNTPMPSLINANNTALKVAGVTMSGCTIQGFKVGIWLKKNGSCIIGAN